MPRRGQHDQSPGDARQPFSDEGGPQGRHARTHDVAREEATRSRPEEPEEDFSADLTSAGGEPGGLGGHVDESTPAADDKELREELALDADELHRLSVVAAGARLEQGGTYVDLNDMRSGPFKAIGSQTAGADNRYVAKRDTDFELWNRLVGQGRQPEVEAPTPAHHDQ